MNKEEIFNELKVALSKAFNFGKTKNFSDYKTVDGIVIASPDENIVVGSEIFIYDEVGTQIPAPSGDYKMEDGSIIIVGEDGKVSEIKAPETPVTEESEDMKNKEDEKYSEKFSAYDSKIAELESKMETLLEAFNKTLSLSEELSKENDNLKQKTETLSTENDELKEKFEKFSTSPSAEPVSKTKIIERELSPEERRTQRILSLKNI